MDFSSLPLAKSAISYFYLSCLSELKSIFINGDENRILIPLVPNLDQQIGTNANKSFADTTKCSKSINAFNMSVD